LFDAREVEVVLCEFFRNRRDLIGGAEELAFDCASDRVNEIAGGFVGSLRGFAHSGDLVVSDRPCSAVGFGQIEPSHLVVGTCTDHALQVG